MRKITLTDKIAIFFIIVFTLFFAYNLDPKLSLYNQAGDQYLERIEKNNLQ